MAFKRLTIMELLEILRRYFDNQNISQISLATGYDRKTIRKYISEVTGRGITSFNKEQILPVLDGILPQLSGRPTVSQEILLPYKDEISDLINNKEDPLKAKTAFEVISLRHELDGKISYSSFKRFVRQNKLYIFKDRTTCRLSFEPGSRVQIDYAKVGTVFDPIAQKRRTAYAFIGTLGYSRHKYIEFVFTQSQQSFVNSHVRMFSFFGGTPKVISPDNLKSGVIKPDLYDPVINRAYGEMAEYYECFVDPCRVATPTDKGMVERDVQTVREQFRKLKAINPMITLAEANKTILDWSVNVYGMRNHGTTQLKPYEEFIAAEQSTLLPQPLEPFEAAFWKEAIVHPDHFIQVQKKAYSIPHQYVGRKVWAKVTHNLVSVYYEEKLIKEHTIPRGFRQTDLNDFPENMRHAMDTGLPFVMRKKANAICPELEELISRILSPHAFINMRKAQGIIGIAEKHSPEVIAEVSRLAIDNYRRITPQLFTALIESVTNTKEEDILYLSDETTGYIRGMEYFINN
jgi:transposase